MAALRFQHKVILILLSFVLVSFLYFNTFTHVERSTEPLVDPLKQNNNNIESTTIVPTVQPTSQSSTVQEQGANVNSESEAEEIAEAESEVIEEETEDETEPTLSISQPQHQQEQSNTDNTNSNVKGNNKIKPKVKPVQPTVIKDHSSLTTQPTIKKRYHHQYGKFDESSLNKAVKATQNHLIEQEKRAETVKGAFLHAWNGYTKEAMGHDNLNPIHGGFSDEWNSWGVTLVDSLDTLLLMNLTSEYKKALEVVKKIDFSKSDRFFSVFEIIIRYLGGLIGAYDLSNDKILLEKAVTLADHLLPVFNTRYGYPVRRYNYGSVKPDEHHETNTLAEIGSLQLEFTRLSKITGNRTYAEKAQKIIDNLDKWSLNIPGLYPVELDIDTNSPSRHDISFGALGDSFYEYLIKRYILTSSTEPQYKKMYETAIDSLHKHMIFQLSSKRGNLVILSELNYNEKPNYNMDHLACFTPGMLMLGGIYLNRPNDFVIGQELVYTCRFLYSLTPTGLGPEKVAFELTDEEKSDTANHDYPEKTERDQIKHKDNRYILRPETIESIYYAYKLTGNKIYQDWAWEIFQAIEKNCKVKYGYGEYIDVFDAKGKLVQDKMESFFLAETLKYLYLIFKPDALDLTKYVLTTEAHPMKITPN